MLKGGRYTFQFQTKKVSVGPLEMTLKQKLEKKSERINSVDEEQPCQGLTASS